MKKGFSKFSLTLAIFCLPTTLWPLALLVSPKFTNSLSLTQNQINGFSIAFWTYPLALFVISGILYKLHRTKPSLARALLVVSFALFYGLLFYIVKSISS